MNAIAQGATTRAARAVLVLLAACIPAGGCDRRSEAAPPTHVSPAVDAARATDDEAAEAAATKVAFAWLGLLGKHDKAGLVAATRVPFVLRDAGRGGQCKGGVAATAEELTSTLNCLLADKLLGDVLQANSDPQGGPVPREILPKWAAKWGKDLGPDAYPIAIVYVGDRASFDFVVVASPDGVRGLFMHKSVEHH